MTTPSHESDSARRCDCGHLESEHTVVYDWSPGLRRCGGVVFAVDQFDPDDRGHREVGCLCNSFHAADESRLCEWAEQVA
jgi:hypothetical protein